MKLKLNTEILFTISATCLQNLCGKNRIWWLQVRKVDHSLILSRSRPQFLHVLAMLDGFWVVVSRDSWKTIASVQWPLSNRRLWPHTQVVKSTPCTIIITSQSSQEKQSCASLFSSLSSCFTSPKSYLPFSVANSISFDETRRDSTRPDKTRQDLTRLNKTRQD